jgi:hypothetical protein
MDRRTFIGTLPSGLLAAPLAAEAQQTAISRVGFFRPAPPSPELELILEDFKRAWSV